MSTPLEVAGAKTNSDLWTAQTLIDNPDLVYQVHLDYFKAGADLTITDTYQTNVDALVRHGLSEEEARDLIKRAVQLANQARTITRRKPVSITTSPVRSGRTGLTWLTGANTGAITI